MLMPLHTCYTSWRMTCIFRCLKHSERFFVFAGILPKRSDLLHVGALGVCLFFNQLMYILGISLSGVLVATCMQPTIPVFTAMLAVCLQLESGSVQKFLGIGLAVLGSMSMVSSMQTCHEVTLSRRALVHSLFCTVGPLFFAVPCSFVCSS